MMSENRGFPKFILNWVVDSEVLCVLVVLKLGGLTLNFISAS